MPLIGCYNMSYRHLIFYVIFKHLNSYYIPLFCHANIQLFSYNKLFICYFRPADASGPAGQGLLRAFLTPLKIRHPPDIFFNESILLTTFNIHILDISVGINYVYFGSFNHIS